MEGEKPLVKVILQSHKIILTNFLIVVLDSPVLVKLKDEAASGVSYDSIDHTSNTSATLDRGFTSAITSSNNSNNDLIYLIHSISPSDVRAYGENSARHCKEEHILLASVFLRRLLNVFPAEAKRRLVPTLAYQLAVSPYAPEELKIEILGALYMEPDIPELNLAIQFQKLIVFPLQNVRGSLPANCPVVFVLDSVQNVDCDTVGVVIRDLAQAVARLHQEGVNAKAVITGVGYHRILKAFTPIQSTTKTHTAPITIPSSFSSRARSAAFSFLDWKYERSEFVQRGVEVGSVCGVLMGLPPLVSLVGMTLLPSPLNAIVGIFGPLFVTIGMTTAMSVAISVLSFREVAKLIWPRSI